MAKEKEKLTEELVMNQVGKILKDHVCGGVDVKEVRILGGGLSTILIVLHGGVVPVNALMKIGEKYGDEYVGVSGGHTKNDYVVVYVTVDKEKYEF